MAASEADIQAVTAFLTNLLANLALEQRISIGLKDAAVLGALARLAPVDYKRVMKALATQPGVAEFVTSYMKARS